MLESKRQKEMQDMQALLYEESQAKLKLQMEADAKDSEIEQLNAKIASMNSDAASLSSGADNDFEENSG